ncbi:MAG: cupredoxin domain-containing protein [Candidatus Taylorbacteria bacterium]
MKPLLISLVLSGAIIGGSFWVTSGSSRPSRAIPENNVSIVDGKQIIEIWAKGGYQPRKSTAKAGIPTILRFNTNGTFDCSSSVRIPSMNVSKSLPQSGSTDIDIGLGILGTLQGSCGMGMYPFEVEFQS